MVDLALWTLMQRVETCRFRAERLEAVSETWSDPNHALAADLAEQWRQVAEQVYALSIGADSPEVDPLRRTPGRAGAAAELRPPDPIAKRLRDLEGRSRSLLEGEL
jgi:hypothetical protein